MAMENINLVSIDETENTLSHFPLNIIQHNILTKLPVKSVLRFKTVCKDWYNYINSSYFINIHRKHALESRDSTDDDLLILCGTCYLFNTSYKFLEPPNYTSGITLELIDVNYTNLYIVGTCNGLICIKCRLSDVPGFVLYNPVTREYSRFINGYDDYYGGDNDDNVITDCCGQYGFGYDVIRQNYKIVNMAFFRSRLNYSSYCSMVYVYSTESSSWKKDEIAAEILQQKVVVGNCGVVANNKLYWVIRKENQGYNNDDCILWFDLHNDEFGEMPRPTILEEYRNDNIDLVVSSGGRLYTILTNFPLSRVSIWVAKEYESWIKLYEIERGQFSARLIQVITLRGDEDEDEDEDEVLLLKLFNHDDTREYVWYDHKNKSIIGKLDFPGNTKYSPGYDWVCTASLAPIPGSDPIKRRTVCLGSSSYWIS